MVSQCDVLPRHGFNQMARNMRCQLYFPYVTEQVVLLRTGVLVHINAYMQALGVTPQATLSGPGTTHQPPASAFIDASFADQASLKAHMNASVGFTGNTGAHSADSANPIQNMDIDRPPGMAAATRADSASQAEDEQTDAAVDAAGDQEGLTNGQSKSSAAGAAAAAALDWHGPIQPEKREELRKVWQHLKETAEALPHVGCYTVASVAYRR